jgi:transposase
MGKGSGMTRGDRRRNARRERLRGLLPRDGAVIGIDLGDEKQAVAVVDHDGRVLARKTVRVKAFRLGEALDWAVGQARAKGFAVVTVACEPTGARWLQVQRLCAERGCRWCASSRWSRISPASSRITRRIRLMRPTAC